LPEKATSFRSRTFFFFHASPPTRFSRIASKSVPFVLLTTQPLLPRPQTGTLPLFFPPAGTFECAPSPFFFLDERRFFFFPPQVETEQAASAFFSHLAVLPPFPLSPGCSWPPLCFFLFPKPWIQKDSLFPLPFLVGHQRFGPSPFWLREIRPENVGSWSLRKYMLDLVNPFFSSPPLPTTTMKSTSLFSPSSCWANWTPRPFFFFFFVSPPWAGHPVGLRSFFSP